MLLKKQCNFCQNIVRSNSHSGIKVIKLKWMILVP